MRISANTLQLVSVLRDLVRAEADDSQSAALVQQLAALPDFEGSRATAGYFVTSGGDIVSDHWWLVMDDDSIFDPSQDFFGDDGFGDVIKCSTKDPRHAHYTPYPGDGNIPVEFMSLANRLKGRNRSRLSFREMLGEEVGAGKVDSSDAAQQASSMPGDLTTGGLAATPQDEFDDETRPEDMQLGWNDLIDEDDGSRVLTAQELQAVEKYADRLFAKVGLDIAFTRHFLDRARDPRNQPEISAAELVRMFKQQYRHHGKRIPRLGPDAEAVMKDMATDVNVPFILKLDRDGMLDLVAKTVMRKPNFGTSDEVFAVEVDHPAFMPGGDEDGGHDPTYDERQSQYNPGHPEP